MSTLPVTPLSQLSNFVDKQQIVCIEGIITKIYEARRGEGQYGPWVMQDANLSDGQGTEVKITIGDDKKLLTPAHEGKKIRISSGHDKKGQLSGLKYQIQHKDGKEYRKVQVGAWAKIDVLDAGGEPVAQPPSRARSNSSASSYGSNTQSSGGRAGAQVGNAINNATLLLAHGLVKPADGQDTLSLLESVAKDILALADKLEKVKPAQSTEKVSGSSWKTAIHPKKGKPLGDLSLTELKKVIQWAFSTTKPKPNIAAFHGQVLLAAAELDITQVSLLVENGADPVGIDKLAEKNFSKKADALDSEEWANVYAKFDLAISEANDLAQELSDDDLDIGDASSPSSVSDAEDDDLPF